MQSDIAQSTWTILQQQLNDEERAQVVQEVVAGISQVSNDTRKVFQAAIQPFDMPGFRDPMKAVRSSPQLMIRRIRDAVNEDIFLAFAIVKVWADLHRELQLSLQAYAQDNSGLTKGGLESQATSGLADSLWEGEVQQLIEGFQTHHRSYLRREVALMAYWYALLRRTSVEPLRAEVVESDERVTTVVTEVMPAEPQSPALTSESMAVAEHESLGSQTESSQAEAPLPIRPTEPEEQQRAPAAPSTIEAYQALMDQLHASWSTASAWLERDDLEKMVTWGQQFAIEVAQAYQASKNLTEVLMTRWEELRDRVTSQVARIDARSFDEMLAQSKEYASSPSSLLAAATQLSRVEEQLKQYQSDCRARLEVHARSRVMAVSALEELTEVGVDTIELSQRLEALASPDAASRSDIEAKLHALEDIQRQAAVARETARRENRDAARAAAETIAKKLGTLMDASLRQQLSERLIRVRDQLPDAVDFNTIAHAQSELIQLDSEIDFATRELDVPRWASTYAEQEDAESFTHLLQALTRAGKPVEVLGLTAAIVHGGVGSGKLNLSDIVVQSVLDGMLRIAPPDSFSDVFVEVFGNSAFLSAIELGSPTEKMALLMPFVAVRLDRPDCLAAEDLYFLKEDGFADRIPAWMKIVEALIMERQPQLIMRDDPAVQEMKAVRNAVDVDLERNEQRRFVHFRTEGNPFLQRMEAEYFLPTLEELWHDLVATSPSANAWQGILTRLEKANPQDLYEHGCTDMGIAKPDQSHFRKRLLERGNNLLDSMRRYAELKLQTDYRKSPYAVEREQLLEELNASIGPDQLAVTREIADIVNRLPVANAEVTPLELASIPTISSASADGEQLAHRLERYFLTDEPSVRAYPSLILSLVSNEFTWQEFVRQLARSLARAPSAEAAYTQYYNGDALQQAQLIATQIGDMERVRQARERANELMTQAQSQKAEIQRYDVQVERAVDRYIVLGQWPRVFQILEQQLSELRRAAQARAAQVNEASRALRRRALELRGRLEEVTLPSTTMDVVYRALEAAEEVGRSQQETRLQGAGMILEAIDHLLDFGETNPSEVQECLDLLQQMDPDRAPQVGGEFSIAEIIEILQMQAYRRLGLPADSYTEAGWDDRIQLFDLWQAIAGLPALDRQLKTADTEQMSEFALFFAKVAKLRAVESDDPERYCRFVGRQRDQLPRLETYFNQPRAVPLRRQVVLLFLTDRDITKGRLRVAQQTIDELELAEKALVLFVTPCDSQPVREFIKQRYERAAFVVLDEPLLREIALAARQHSAVGQLRANFMRATGAQAAEVFQFNGQVDGVNSIFVGRDNIVSRLAMTPQCFAVYGGRRIGKTSVLHAVDRALCQRGVLTALVSFEGFVPSPTRRLVELHDFDASEAERRLARQILQSLHDNAQHSHPGLAIDDDCSDLEDFRLKMNRLLALNPGLEVVVLIDEMDVYILGSDSTHQLIEVMRGIRTEKGNCRFIFAGFVEMYKQISGKGYYAGRRSPWSNFLDGSGTLMRELMSAQAQRIIREGFNETLGFSFQTPTVPQRIVEYTTGHPAFVQKFCAQLHHHLTRKQSDLIAIEDVDAVLDDEGPNSFVNFVAETMELNLLPLQQLIVRAVAKEENLKRFRVQDVEDVLASYTVHVRGGTTRLADSIDELLTASVLREERSQVYTFSVPSYAEILRRLELVKIDRFNELIEEAHAAGDLT